MCYRRKNVPFIFAALDSVICLVERDCDTTVGDKNSFLAAHLAARYDQLDCLRFLVQQGTALDAVQSEKRTPVHVVSGQNTNKTACIFSYILFETYCINLILLNPTHSTNSLNHINNIICVCVCMRTCV